MKTKLFFPLALLASFVFLQSNNKSSESPPAGALEKISTALPTEAAAKPMKARKLLVFSATAGFRHASIATGKVALSELGKKTGAFEAVISDDLANFEPDAIQQFDAICFLSTTQDVLSPHPQVLKKMSDEEKKAATEHSARLRKSLMDFIESGKGFVGIHAATDTLYNMPEYGRMIGGYFNGHPWNAAAEVQIDVEKGVEKHPLAAMFEGQSMNFKEEIYQHKDPYNSRKQQILLRLNVEKSAKVGGMKRADGDYGVSWARNHGKGRVFYCSLGHNHEMYWNAKILSHYLAGIQWSLGDLQAKVEHE
ncbi:MAG: ThuA domain-containing protein [Akkermansiaceae bacterium]